ncbi:alcohol dehydrogenase, propanol-preferring [Pelagirhabdus alkalitolerans]|uniref:Alcohol dehydrogenase n=1 Tax=Pelagirhabdus alkalitolerans TaxID=1612202 RepID=A0A1G6MNH4_9BACI|nr:zinc-binding dehydrogenase [Pelagirhabdus alkalitolerans]SDC56525.1 alcohol dehydrogenase, propanol-preferring [Pelagirhabdus alkalitolerans]
MKGWLFTETGVDPKLIEKEDPKAKDDEVVIDVKAAGLCHSDVGALQDPGWMELITAAPVIFGHECAGVISEVGEGVTDWKVGDRVGVAPQHPETNAAIGYQRDGGYATKIAVPSVQLVSLPDNVSFVEGAAATDAGMTSHHAIFDRGGAKKGMKIGIVGIGGLGQFGAQMALIEGCEVIAADVSPNARALAEEIGCHKVYEDVSEMKADEPEVIIDFAGFGETTTKALDVVPRNGRVVVVGMGKLDIDLSTYTLITKQLDLLGSNGGTVDDVAGVYKFFATGKLKPQLETISFEEIKDGLDRLKRHEVRGRLVALVNQDDN